MPDYNFPSAAELQEVSQELLPVLTQDDPLFTIMPFEEDDADILLWDQEDIYIGLQQVRGLNGEPGRVKQVGAKRYMATPGVYGEYLPLDEIDLTRRRQYGTFGTPINIDDLVMRKQRQLLTRRINRIKYIGWSLLANGVYSVANGEGSVLATDAYTFQTFTPSVPWNTYATATPLADLRAIQLLSRGWSVSFGRDAKLLINRGTWNDFIKNTNAADLYGRRTQGLGTYESLPQINQLLLGDDLPTLEVYDGTYRDDSNNVQLFIPNGAGIVVGKRPAGEAVMRYRFTRNASNPNLAPGPYMAVVEPTPGRPPRKIEVHDGHNGGPVVFHPMSIVQLSGLHT